MAKLKYPRTEDDMHYRWHIINANTTLFHFFDKHATHLSPTYIF